MRKLYLAPNDPPTLEDEADGAALGATEIVGGIPPALASLGITTLGYHEIADPTPPIPESVEMRKAQLQMLDTPWGPGTLLDAVEAAVAASPKSVQIEWAKATEISRTRDLVRALQAGLGVSDAMMDALFVAADARP